MVAQVDVLAIELCDEHSDWHNFELGAPANHKLSGWTHTHTAWSMHTLGKVFLFASVRRVLRNVELHDFRDFSF